MSEELIKRPSIRIDSLHRSEAVHATTSNPRIDFVKLAGMNVGMGQSITMDALRLMVDLSFGVTEFTYRDNSYVLALRNARLFLELDNAEIEPGTSYKAELQRGSVARVAKAATNLTHSSNIEGNVETEAKAGWKTLMPEWAVSVRAGGKGAAARGSTDSSSTETSVTTRLEIVAPAGQNSWMIGCPGHGDPRHEKGWLFGEIITANQGDTLTPLCVLSALDHNKPVGVRLVVVVDAEHFSLEGSESNQRLDELSRKFQEMNAQTLHRRLKTERDLRSKVAMLAASKSGFPTSQNADRKSLVLMSRTMFFNPIKEATKS